MEVRIEGVGDVEKQLQDLMKKLGADKVEPVLLNAAKDLAKEMKSNLARVTDEKTGNLKKAIGAKKLKRYLDNPAAGAGIKYGYKGGNHAHLIEYGTAERFHKSGKSVGAIQPRPFVRPAWDTNKDRIINGIIEELKGMIKL